MWNEGLLGRGPGTRRDEVKRAALVSGSLALMLVASGCATATDGPLRFEDHGLDYCATTDDGGEGFGVGIPLDYEAGTPITIGRISSSESDGVRIVGAVVVKVREDRIGTTSWPLPRSYGRAVVADGATIPSDEQYDLVVHAESSGSSGGTAGVVSIEYTQGGREYIADTHTTVRMKRSC